MIVRPISAPLAGEHVIAVEPRLAYPHVDAGWLKRLRLFSGRALDEVALTAEQANRAGKLALLGQTRSPGIVTGLDVALETVGTAQFLHIAPGIGLLPSGEDVVLGHELRVALPSLGAIAPALRAAILIMRPITTTVLDRFDPEDQCDRDETEDAFSDKIVIDAAQLELVAWKPAWGALDATSAQRNRLAYRVFETERALAFGEIPAWQVDGVPLALIGLDNGAITYVDRHAVARTGGDPPARAPLVAEVSRFTGMPSLWQAQLLQLVDHLADLRTTAGVLPSVTSAQLATLPPAGVIPRDAIDLATPYTNRFFPPTWRLQMAPVPAEQLDGVLARAAGLAPLSTAISEEVMVLVPVPQAVYEPHLLEREHEGPEFAAALADLIVERTDWLGRRLYLRGCRDALVRAVDPASVVADTDPGKLEDEGTIGAVSAAEESFEVEANEGVLRSSALIALKKRLDTNTAMTDAERGGLFDKGLVKFIADLQLKIQQADDAIDFGFLRAQSDIYRVRQLMLGNVLGSKLATSPALSMIAKGETSGAVREDLSALYASLKKTPVRTSTPTPITDPSTPVTPNVGVLFSRSVDVVASPAAERVAEAAGLLRAAPHLPLMISATGLSHAAPRPLVAIAGRDRDGQTLETLPTAPVAGDIREGSAIVGASDFRNVTAAQRLEPPPSSESRQYAVASRHEGLQSLQALHDLGLNVDDITVYAVPGATPVPAHERPSKTFKDIRLGTGGIGAVLADPTPASLDESGYFHETVTLVEAHIGTLRGLEGRIAQYRAILGDCQRVLAAVRATSAHLAARLATVEHELADVRHAIATTRALRAEELARIDRVNARRSAVLQEYATMLAYVRPRFFEGIAEVPEISLDPELLESPVPGCIAGHGDAPPELEDMVALLREAPLAWFRLGPPILSFLDRVDLLHGAVVTAKTRAVSIAATGFQTRFATDQIVGRFAKAVTSVGRAQVDSIWEPRAQVAEVDLRNLIGLSWTESRNVAQQIVSLGDLIEGAHRRAQATAAAHTVISNIESVAGCLWAQIGQISPTIRLGWAEALDQYDRDHMTINLPALPAWRDVPVLDRKSIELLAQWLIGQIDRTIPAAVTWMHDLVRACILLASHAPIDEIVTGSVQAPSNAGPGHLVPVKIDPTRIKIGMAVTFFAGHDAVAHGIVEDLIGNRASARIAQATTPTLRLEVDTRARFSVAGSPASPLTRSRA